MSLKNPTKKMSKSDADPMSRILITDSKEEIDKKIKSALTDSIEGISYDRETRPGVSNLIDIMYHLDESIAKSPQALAGSLKDTSMRALKSLVAESIDQEIRNMRGRYEALMGQEPRVLRKLADQGADQAYRLANPVMRSVRKALGVNWKDT